MKYCLAFACVLGCASDVTRTVSITGDIAIENDVTVDLAMQGITFQ